MDESALENDIKIEEVEEEEEKEEKEEEKEKVEEIIEIDDAVAEKEEIKESFPWIFFDYSGTLVDTVVPLSKSYTRFLGREFQVEQVKNLYKDYPKHNKLGIMIKYKINPIKFIFGGKKKFDEIRKEEFWKGVRAFPGIPDVLARLHKMSQVKIAIVTHETELEDEEEREKIMQKFGIPNVFDTVICDYWNKEESFEKFLQENEVSYGLFIGDTQYDLDIGKKNSFDTVGVTWGFSTKEELEADHIIGDPRELLQIIISLLRKAELEKLHGDPI